MVKEYVKNNHIHKIMGQKKGQTGNPAGRPKGSPNRTTAEIKELINQFISGNLDDLQTNYDALEPEKKLQFFRDLLKYVIPTKESNDININTLSEIELERLTDNLILKLK